MATVVVRRPPRRPAPDIPSDRIPVAPPPEIPQPTGGRWQQAVQVLPMVVGTVAMALMMGGRAGGAFSYVMGGVFGVSALAMAITTFVGAGTPKKAEMMAARREYLRHLAGLRRQVRRSAAAQRAGLYYRHPDPDRLWSTVDSFRLWERRPHDADFAVARVAVGPQALATPLDPPATRPLDELEPLTAGALRRFLDAYSVLDDLPVAVSLRGFGRLFVGGREDDARALVRAVVAQLAVFHAPEDLLITVCAGPERRAAWEWVKWLPHALHPTEVDALGALRLVASTARDLERRLGDLIINRPRFHPTAGTPPTPHIVVVLDGGDLAGSQHLAADGGIGGVTVLDLGRPPPRMPDRAMAVLEVTGRRRALVTTTRSDEDEVGVADGLGLPAAEALARQLAPLRLAAAASATTTDPHAGTRERGLPELLGIGAPDALDVDRAWAPRANRDRLRVPIGVGLDGEPVEIDLKESAQDGMGPHGLLIGATGSGKSEVLRTLVLALIATHSSETLNLVLVDFKGGATFTSLERVPHVAAVITNLEQELVLVDRMVDALNGELVRRQELLRTAGNYASVRDYERAREGGAPLAPLPSLLIICDEFSELLTAKPDFIELFVQIGRLGRSLGVHLLLASQRLEEGRLRGLETHLSYRIGLRTFSALESRTVLGVPDAYELPRSPGHGYLRFGTEPLVRFTAAYVSGPYRPADAVADGDGPGAPRRVFDYTTDRVPLPEPPGVRSPDRPAGRGESLLDIVAERLVGRGVPAHRVWLPPLSAPPALDDLLGPVANDPVRGLTVTNPQLRGSLQIPVGLVDKPYEQRRDLLWMRLDGAAGHAAVVGGPQSGKSTALRSVVAALALTHTPSEVQVYCLDFGGGSLRGVRGLPHVGGVAGRLDVAAVRRTIGEITSLLARRELRFAADGIDSMASYRRRRAARATGPEAGATASGSAAGNAAPAEPWGDVFLVIDGWATLRCEYEDLEPVVTDLATRGLSYGIHLIITASRWMDLRPAIRDLFGSRLELRLGDPSDSTISRRAAMDVPERTPGRGITSQALHLLTAVPRLSTRDPADLVGSIAAAWPGPAAPQVRLLPTSVPRSAIDNHRDPGNPLALPIGIAEADLAPVRVDFRAEPHFMLFGDAECGKSTFLRALATTITGRFLPEQARIILVDHRRSLLGAVATDHLIGYATTADQTAELSHSVAGYLRERLPGPDVTPEQLRHRSWWTGPECFVLVDDYDLVAGGLTNPLAPLLEYLAQARDVGLHLVVTRRSGGAGRAMYEQVIQRMRELSSPGLIMSGNPDEGVLLGNVKPAALPPGRGWLVTRREGARLIQLADQPAT